jgi:hypothetical protein
MPACLDAAVGAQEPRTPAPGPGSRAAARPQWASPMEAVEAASTSRMAWGPWPSGDQPAPTISRLPAASTSMARGWAQAVTLQASAAGGGAVGHGLQRTGLQPIVAVAHRGDRPLARLLVGPGGGHIGARELLAPLEGRQPAVGQGEEAYRAIEPVDGAHHLLGRGLAALHQGASQGAAGRTAAPAPPAGCGRRGRRRRARCRQSRVRRRAPGQQPSAGAAARPRRPRRPAAPAPPLGPAVGAPAGAGLAREVERDGGGLGLGGLAQRRGRRRPG